MMTSLEKNEVMEARIDHPHWRRRRRRYLFRFFKVVVIATTASATAMLHSLLPLVAIIHNIASMTASASGNASRRSSSSRAYPLGCLHRQPSYYTYDERDDVVTLEIIPSNEGAAAAAVDEPNSIVHPESAIEIDHVDFRTLPNKSSKLRRSYCQYRLIRRLGSGKFSDVFEAVDMTREFKLRRTQQQKQRWKIQEQRRRKRIAMVQQSRRQRKKMANTQPHYDDNDDEKNKSSVPDDDDSRRRHDLVEENNEDEMIDPQINNSLVVLKCLKPISERKIRRELLVLTHCNTLPNVARLIGIILPESMDGNGDTNNNISTTTTTTTTINIINNNKNVDEAVEHNDKASLINQYEGENMPVKEQSSLTTATSSSIKRLDWRLIDKKPCGMQNHQPEQQQLPALVLEHAGPNSQWLCHNAPQQQQPQQQQDHLPAYLTEHEIKYYLCHLLIALDGLHAAGIMHRDVKPRNMLINRRLLKRNHHRQQYDNHDGYDQNYMSNGEPDDDDDVESNSDENEGKSSARHSSQQQSPSPLMLVDLGLADFYHPGKSYNVRVASRHYKSPELLIGYDTYDYSLDLWAAGCILAGLLFRKEPFFRGKDNDDQLGRIVSVLGVQDFLCYRRKCNVRLSAGARAAIGKYCWKATTTTSTSSTATSSLPLSFSASSSSSSSSSSEDEDVQSVLNSSMRHRKPWHTFLSPNCPVPSSAGLDLLDKLLVYDHEQRWTAREALNHEFFDDVRDQVWEEVRKRMEWESSRRTKKQLSFADCSIGVRQGKKRRE